MSPDDRVGDAIERLEWDERKMPDDPFKTLEADDPAHRADRRRGGDRGDRARGLRLEQEHELELGGDDERAGRDLRESRSHKFVMVNHVTTNSFFTATIYGCQDACALTGSSFQWTGSTDSIVSQMVSAFNSGHRREGERDRVLSDRQHRVQRTRRPGAEQGHSGDRVQRRRLAGLKEQPDGLHRPEQPHRGRRGRGGDPQSGREVGRPRRRDHRDAGDREHPAADRRREARPDRAPASSSRRSGPRRPRAAPEYNKISAWYAGHQDVKWMMAVDSGDSNAVAQFIQKQGLKGKVGASVWDVGLPVVAGHPGRLRNRHDRPAGLPAGLPDDHAALPVERVGRPDEADEHRHGTRHRHQGQRHAVPDAEQVRGNVHDKEGIDDAVLDSPRLPRACQRTLQRPAAAPEASPPGQQREAPSRGRVGSCAPSSTSAS